METLELLIGLLAAVAVVVRLAGRTPIPEPVLLLLAGLAVALIPGLPEVELDPELTLALFLPPLLYWAALHIDLRQLRANLRPIGLLAVGLVLVTTAAVALLAHSVLGMPWAVAVVLGAIVSPPDPVAATAVAGRLGLPRRMVSILEGEGLLNDATALVLYRVAVAAAVSGTFSIGEAGVELAVSAVGGTAVGLAVGFIGSRVLRRVSEAPVENTVKLLLPYVAWLAAERLHVSGVLAVLACGLLMARHWSSISSGARLQARQLWDWLVFVLEGLSFVLVGVQLRTVVDGIEGRSLADLALAAAAVNLVVIAVRMVLVFPASWLPRLSARLRERDPYPGWRYLTVIGWAGMRGVVTLALALAIPTEVEGGGPFPDRNLVVFLAFSVIVVSLVGEGLTLPLLIRRLGLTADDDGPAGDGRQALARLSEVALDHLDAIDPEIDGVPAELVERLRERYRTRLAHLGRQGEDGQPDDTRAYADLVSDLLGAQREELRRLRERRWRHPRGGPPPGPRPGRGGGPAGARAPRLIPAPASPRGPHGMGAGVGAVVPAAGGAGQLAEAEAAEQPQEVLLLGPGVLEQALHPGQPSQSAACPTSQVATPRRDRPRRRGGSRHRPSRPGGPGARPRPGWSRPRRSRPAVAERAGQPGARPPRPPAPPSPSIGGPDGRGSSSTRASSTISAWPSSTNPARSYSARTCGHCSGMPYTPGAGRAPRRADGPPPRAGAGPGRRP